MTFPANPAERSPKGDHNRRLSLGIDADEFATTAGISQEELRRYEFADVDEQPDPAVAERVGRALERLEAVVPPKVDNGDAPNSDSNVAKVNAALRAPAFLERLAVAYAESAEQLVANELMAIDPMIRLTGVGERSRGVIHEVVVHWRGPNDSQDHEEVVVLPVQN